MHDWLVELKNWIQLLQPIWIFLLIVFIRPIKNYFITIYQRHVGNPVKTNETRLDKLTEKVNELEILKEGQKALLHSMIFSEAKKVLNKGIITTSELDNLDELMIPYKALGGNGTAKKLVNECKKLKLKQDE